MTTTTRPVAARAMTYNEITKAQLAARIAADNAKVDVTKLRETSNKLFVITQKAIMEKVEMRIERDAAIAKANRFQRSNNILWDMYCVVYREAKTLRKALEAATTSEIKEQGIDAPENAVRASVAAQNGNSDATEWAKLAYQRLSELNQYDYDCSDLLDSAPQGVKGSE